MIVDIEKLKTARTILRARMYGMQDGILEQSIEIATDLLRDIIDDLELGKKAIIELKKEGGPDEVQLGKTYM
jgi:hypothetical protein